MRNGECAAVRIPGGKEVNPMSHNPENLERPNKSETSKPIKNVSASTIKALGKTAIKGGKK
jgi:hypothetical protein